MKLIKYIAVSLVGLLFILFISISLYVRLNGETIVVNKLSQVFQEPIKIASVHYSIPLALHLYELEIGERFKIQQVKVYVNPLPLITGQAALLSLTFIQPSLIVTEKMLRGEEGQLDLSKSGETDLRPLLSLGKNKNNLDFIVDQIEVKRGRLDEINHIIHCNRSYHENFLRIENIQAKVNLRTRQDVRSERSISLNADIYSRYNRFFEKGHIRGRGWCDLENGDMDIDFDVSSFQGERILEASLDAKDKNMQVDGQLFWTLSLEKMLDKYLRKSSSLNDVFDNLRNSKDVDVATNFSFQTRMDDLKISKVSFSGNAGTNSVEP